MKSFAVIGLGRFGSRLAKSLYQSDNEVLAIDKHEELVQEIADHVTRAVVADGREPEVLKTLGVQNCDCAIVGVGADLAPSVLITMNLKNLGVSKIICKAYDETHCAILKKLGADQVIIPEQTVADKIATSLSTPNILESIELSDTYGIVETLPPKSWIGKTIRDLSIRPKYGISVIAVKTGDQTNVSPSAETKISDNCILVLLGEYENLDKIQHLR